jgi:phosphomannomutase
MFELIPQIVLPSGPRVGSVQHYTEAIHDHINGILALPEIDVEAVKRRKFKVCLDSINGVHFPNFVRFLTSLGAGGPIMKTLLEKFGCEVHCINYEQTGDFFHNPEPITENLVQL